jgi:hypothetical protein
MFKFMRKYNRWLIAIFGSFLMLTFLFSGTSSLFQPNPKKILVATTNTTPIRAAEHDIARRELDFMDVFAPELLANLRMNKGDVDHWVLLCREAKAAGLLGEPGDGRDIMPELARARLSRSQQMQDMVRQRAMFEARQRIAKEKNLEVDKVDFMEAFQSSQQLISEPGWIDTVLREYGDSLSKQVPLVAGKAGLASEDEAYLGLAKARAINRLITLTTYAGRLSDKRMALGVRAALNNAQVNGVVLPATRLVSDTPAPSEEKVKELFEKYRTVKPGTGEFGFGYLQPNRVKLEWMTISKASIDATIKIDPIDANKKWQQNRATYTGEFAAERARIESDLREEKASNTMAEIDRLYKAEYRRATRQLKVDQGRKLLPADWTSQQPRMEQLAQIIVAGIKETEKRDLALPAVTIEANAWTPVQRLGDLPGLGQATYTAGSRRGTLSELISMTIELDPASAAGLQAMVPYEQPLRDNANNMYFLQILAVAPESAPKDLAEVRDAVVKDAHLLAAYERLASMKDALAAGVVSGGLDSIKAAYPGVEGLPADMKVEDIKDAVINRLQGSGSAVLQDKSVRETIFQAIDKLGEKTVPDESNLSQRVVAAMVPSARSLAIFIVTAQEPASQERLRAIDPMAVRAYMTNQELTAAGLTESDPFGFEALKQRTGYRAAHAKSDEESEKEEKPPAKS